MDPIAVLVGLGCVGLVGLLAVLILVSARRERARQDRIQRWAAQHGWTYAVGPDVGWEAQLPRGDKHGVTLLVAGTVGGRQVSVAEYWYTTESTSTSTSANGLQTTSTSTTTHHLLVVATRLPTAYPPLAVVPRGALSRLGRTIFGDSKTATGHDAFDRQFRVQTKDPALVRHLLGPVLIGEHLARRVPPWQVAGQDLLYWHAGTIGDPNEIPNLVAPLARLADMIGR
jgi:hypothetical protein